MPEHSAAKNDPPCMMTSSQGAALQTYNNELVKTLDELCARRKALQREIDADEAERLQLESQLQLLQRQLDAVGTRLDTKQGMRDQYDKTIAVSEQGYMKILDSSQTLLSVVRKGAQELEKAKVDEK